MFFDANLGNIGAESEMTAIVETAHVADELGFRALWSADHLLAPLSVPQFGRVYEPLVTLAYIASTTRRIRLGTSVIVLPMRSPFVMAKQVATLDGLFKGRIILGIGAGWSAEEFANVHAYFHTRGARMDESIRLFRHLWSGSQAAFDAGFYGYPGGIFEPVPAQGKDLPLLVGGRSDAALKRAARHAAFWHTFVVGREFELTVARLRAEPGGERVEVAFSLPISVLILRGFFRSIPGELEDASYIDGCGPVGFMWRVLLPLSVPALAIVAVLTMVSSWNRFLLPLVVANTEQLFTLPLGVMQFQGQYGTDIALVMAFLVLAMIPAVVFYLFAERYLVGGLDRGSDQRVRLLRRTLPGGTPCAPGRPQRCASPKANYRSR